MVCVGAVVACGWKRRRERWDVVDGRRKLVIVSQSAASNQKRLRTPGVCAGQWNVGLAPAPNTGPNESIEIGSSGPGSGSRGDCGDQHVT